MVDLCENPDHKSLTVFPKNYDGVKIPVCADCGKKVNRKNPKWYPTCDRCFCRPSAHGKTMC